MKQLIIITFLLGSITIFAQDSTENPAKVFISPQQTLPKDNIKFRKAIINWSDKVLKSTNYQNIKAHPSSYIFPGLVKPGYQFVSKTINISHKKIADSLVSIVSTLGYSGYDKDNMYSTGLYVAAGEYIEINVSENSSVDNLSVQIGAHSDRLDIWVAGEEDWRRMPIITKKQILKIGKNTLASPFGGLIYININPKAEDRKIDLSINHVIVAQLFELGKTLQNDWENQLKNNKAPWGEIATQNIILTLPDSVLQTIKNPEQVLKLWDLVVLGELDLANIPSPFYRAQRLVTDEHIGGGYMHSGYPIMIHHSPTQGMFTNEIMANPELLMKPSKGGANWGFFHEIGHNMQNLNWVFGGTTEVSNNFFSIYMFDRLMGGRDDSHIRVSSENTQKMMKEYFADGAGYEKWKSDPFLGLIMFRQMQEGFGWESFKLFFKEYQKIGASISRLSDQEKRDLWVKTYSNVVKRNLAPFWEIWGIPISDDIDKELSKYPLWKPFNFPPRN